MGKIAIPYMPRFPFVPARNWCWIQMLQGWRQMWNRWSLSHLAYSWERMREHLSMRRLVRSWEEAAEFRLLSLDLLFDSSRKLFPTERLPASLWVRSVSVVLKSQECSAEAILRSKDLIESHRIPQSKGCMWYALSNSKSMCLLFITCTIRLPVCRSRTISVSQSVLNGLNNLKVKLRW